MVAMYCLYHGRQGLRNVATNIHLRTVDLAESVKAVGHVVKNERFFDTLYIQPKTSLDQIKQRAREKRINLRYYDDGHVGVSLDERVSDSDLADVKSIFQAEGQTPVSIGRGVTFVSIDRSNLFQKSKTLDFGSLARQSRFLTNEIFSKYVPAFELNTLRRRWAS